MIMIITCIISSVNMIMLIIILVVVSALLVIIHIPSFIWFKLIANILLILHIIMILTYYADSKTDTNNDS